MLYFFRKRPGEEVAAKPHRITIVQNFVSPLLALVAVVLAGGSFWTSQQALRVSETSMKVGQRAYLSLRNGVASMGQLVQGGPRLFVISVKFDVYNSGNTPAQLESAVLRSGLPVGWKLVFDKQRGNADTSLADERSIRVKLSGEVGQGANTTRSMDLYVQPTEEGFVQYESFFKSVQGRYTPFRIDGFLSYRDTFGEKQNLSWCWHTGQLLSYPTTCEPDSSFLAEMHTNEP